MTSRPVLFTGLAAGTAITVLAVWDGLRLNVPGVPSILRVVLGVLILWALFAAVGAVLSELTVRHHRAVLRHGWRHGKRGGRAAIRGAGMAYRGAAHRSRPWRTRVLTAMRARWAARGAEPLLSRRKGIVTSEPETSEPVTGKETSPPPDGRTYSWGWAGAPSQWPADDLETAHTWARQMSGDGRPYLVTGYPPGGGPGRTVVTYVNGEAAYNCDLCGKPMPAGSLGIAHPDCIDAHENGNATQPTEGNTMTETPVPATAPAPHSGHRVLTIGGTVPGEWKNLVAITADFEPEDDAELLAWMASEVNGMSAYAEALTEVYETGISSLGLDPVSLAALHDTADAAADAAQAMAYARQKFAAHYGEVREFAASGGLLPHDGRWITGDGE